ncbi:protein of unknown function [Methylorubrum extorquens DM4]|uniref:Uncharacterized protein n=1 Tax=Methylorubrum extorquens (strain DSM 6343 / CIP 106787 / DM4) TaxID=661410 RepID=C7CF56_METED|nr:protein of unknown function [Methylorubrum extorquens DM4]
MPRSCGQHHAAGVILQGFSAIPAGVSHPCNGGRRCARCLPRWKPMVARRSRSEVAGLTLRPQALSLWTESGTEGQEPTPRRRCRAEKAQDIGEGV